MPSSRCVVALLEPPQAFVRRPCAKCASTSRGCVGPRSRTKSSSAAARRRVVASHGRAAMRGCISARFAARQEAVVDEGSLPRRQPRIAPLEIAGAIADDAMAQRQVLSARRRADRIGLHEAEPVDRALQRRRLEQRAGDRVAAQVVERRRRRWPSGDDAARRRRRRRSVTRLQSARQESRSNTRRRQPHPPPKRSPSAWRAATPAWSTTSCADAAWSSASCRRRSCRSTARWSPPARCSPCAAGRTPACRRTRHCCAGPSSSAARRAATSWSCRATTASGR